ncbi:MAG: two-component regulator propeller domain-containing protein [Bacteroidota bacterium]
MRQLHNNATLLLLMAFALSASGHTYDFEHYTTRDGLPHNYITSVYQDAEGYIWLATRNGVSRFDGYDFKTYSTVLPDHTKIPSFSQHVLESSDGVIWTFGPIKYSYYLNDQEFVQHSDDYVFGYPDHRGNLWFVSDTSLFRIKLDSADIIDDTPGSEENRLRLVCRERDNTRWVFREFNQQQLQKSAAGHGCSFAIEPGKQEPLILNSVHIDSDNTIWISSFNRGLIRADQEEGDHLEFQFYAREDQGIPQFNIYSVYEMEENLLWVGTSEGVIILHKNSNKVEYIKHDQLVSRSLSDNVVSCFYKASSGAIFVGTRYGLNVGNLRKFNHEHRIEGKNSIIHNNVHAFLEDDHGNLWILSSGGIDKLNQQTNLYESFPVTGFGSGSLKAPPVSICHADSGNFWIGTWNGGLHYFQPGESLFNQYLHNSQSVNSINNKSIMSLFHDSRNQIWIGTWGSGLNMLDPETGKFKVFASDPADERSLSYNEVSCFAEDHEGRLWIGTMCGLNLLIDHQQKIFKRIFYKQTDSLTLSNNQITSLHIRDSVLWIGTSHGLNSLDLENLSIKRHFTADGLPSNQIKAIVDDQQGNLWVSTNRGLARLVFNAEDNSRISRIISFSTFDGLQDNEFLDRSGYRSVSGEIFFGGTNGYNRFNPEEIIADTFPPESVITKFSVDGKEISIGEPIPGTRKITISHKQKSFSLEFAGLRYMEPSGIQYKYRLNGFDDEWQVSDAQSRRAIYTNINKGTYEFQVISGTRHNYWEDTPARLTIEVLPPFWRTGWFTGLTMILILLVIFLFIELRTRIIKKQKQKLEQIVELRTSEILEQKISIEQQQEEIAMQAAHIKQMNQLLKEHNIKLKKDLASLSKARVLQKLLDYSEFKKIFPSENTCIEYLVDLKWANGYRCQRCGHKEYNEEKKNSRRCRQCNYTESATAGTIFHHLRFPIDKALYILIITSTGRKINVSELSRKLDIRLKTVWNFHHKVKEELIGLKEPIRSEEGWASLIVKHKNR